MAEDIHHLRHGIGRGYNKNSMETSPEDQSNAPPQALEPPPARSSSAMSPRGLLILPSLAIAAFSLCMTVPHYIAGETVIRSEIFQHLFVTQELFGALGAIGILLAAWVLGSHFSWDARKFVYRVGEKPWGLFLVVLVGLSISTQIIYHNHPLSIDEYAPVFQSEVFAQGKLTAEVPPPLLLRLFPLGFINIFWAASAEEGRLISNYWPGHALLLTPFSWLGLPWLLNPLMVVGALALLWHLAKRLGASAEGAGWVLLLAVVSPEFLVNGISFYSMTGHLFFNLLFVVLLLDQTPKRLFLAGFVGSMALVLHQPVPHLLIALPWLLHLLWRRDRFRTLPWLGLGYVGLCLLLGVGWFYLRASFQADWARLAATEMANSGAGTEPGLKASINLLIATAKSLLHFPNLEWIGLRFKGYLKLFLWALPGLPILAGLGFWERRQNTTVRLLGWTILSTLVGFFMLPISQGHGWGFRYFHQLWWVLPLLAGLAVAKLCQSRPIWAQTMSWMLVVGLLVGVGLRFYQVEGFIARHLAQLPQVDDDKHQVMFLDCDVGYYKQDLVRNGPFLNHRQLRMLSFGRARDEALLRRFFPGARLVFDDGRDTVWEIDPPPR